MAHKAKDGSEHTNRMMANRRNASLDAKQDQSAPPSDPTQEQSGPEDGSSNPDADQHVDALLASGMTPDDIHAHAKKRSGAHGAQESAPARTESSASLSSIPGM